ncbi:MAG: 6-phosphofructokinase [Gammaproteobacteria bacterium]
MTQKAGRMNILYAQSGGVTAVINATAWAVIDAAHKAGGGMGRVLVGRDGIVGVLEERLIDTAKMTPTDLARLRMTPAGAFGSCRFKLGTPETDPVRYGRILKVCAAHRIGYFFYNGGGDSQDTAQKIASFSRAQGYPLKVIGLPKTIDNDLYGTDFSPGYGSVAKYIATSTLEAALDVASMSSTSTKVFILEVMGRHAGWIAAASALSQRHPGDPPHLILFPERIFDPEDFIARVRKTVESQGFCVVVASEGIRGANGGFIAEGSGQDAFGHAQLGGVAPALAGLIGTRLGYKYHWAVADYLQRAARHLASKTDFLAAMAVGRAAVRLARVDLGEVMVTLERLPGTPTRFRTGSVPLVEVANRERTLPPDFMSADGYGISHRGRLHLAPLIAGEAYPPYRAGTPDYLRLSPTLIKKRLPPFGAR